MRPHLLAVFAVALVVINAFAGAVTPEQVGDYSGTIKLKVFETSGTSTQQFPMLLTIGADLYTTTTINGEVYPSGGSFGPTYGVLLYDELVGEGINLLSLHYKKGSFKGTGTGYSSGDPATSRELKVKLKKIP